MAGAVNAARFIEFLDGLVRDAQRKVFLVLDNLKVHHSKLVKEWLSKHTEEIELFFLPAYSPDLNPDEHPYADVKQGVGSGGRKLTLTAIHGFTTGSSAGEGWIQRPALLRPSLLEILEEFHPRTVDVLGSRVEYGQSWSEA